MAQVLELEKEQIEEEVEVKVEQTMHTLNEGGTNRYCAVGAALHEVFGFDHLREGHDAAFWYRQFDKEFGIPTNTVITLNDTHEKSFTQIADILESWL